MTIYGANMAIWDSIAMYGHELGDHNDYITMEHYSSLEMDKVIPIWHDIMLDQGIHITGTAAHGARECSIYDYINYEYFAGFARTDSVTIDGVRHAIGTVSLYEMGYDYEAYDLDKDYYFSDVGGSWNILGDPADNLQYIECGAKVIILAHPIWWDLEGF